MTRSNVFLILSAIVFTLATEEAVRQTEFSWQSLLCLGLALFAWAASVG